MLVLARKFGEITRHLVDFFRYTKRMPLPFHPLISAWFTETYGKPTAVQEEAWPLITAGKDILAIAPTGSGKTLTAFLAALSRFVEGAWNPEELCVLYVSPLKALNEDIRRNLIEPIETLKRRARAAQAGAAAVEDSPLFRIRVETRSGDTPQSERRRFLLHPPSILAVTPESLAILLLNPRGREVLSHVRFLVIDEIHAVMGTKRGAFLSCQIDRLLRITGRREEGDVQTDTERSFQRVALSATVNPPERAAEFAGGLVRGKDDAYKQRPLVVVAPPAEKKISFSVMFPPGPENAVGENSAAATTAAEGVTYGTRYTILTNHILERITALKNGSLLVFTDSRRRAERIAYLVNEKAGTRVALCHHGSLSKDLRREVEQSLVQGIIPCVIATSSLELGLDIGDVDEVILAGTPASCARSLQRIGRSGHGVGEESRGVLFPFTGMDLLLGAVMAGAVAEREIEASKLIKNPLDILAQCVLALCAEEPRTPDELFGIIRDFAVFSGLARSSFDQVIAMLTGKYFRALNAEDGTEDGKDKIHADNAKDGAESIRSEEDIRIEEKRLRELKPLLYQDLPESSEAISNETNSAGIVSTGKLYAAEGTLALLYSSGGVIASRGLYSMRLPDGTKIGELDEEFVWERRIGEGFDFGARSWQIIEIGSEAVTVSPLSDAANFQPFWHADVAFRSATLCKRTLDFFNTYNTSGIISNSAMLSTEAAAALEEYLFRQRNAQGGLPLPDHKNIPVEIIDDPALRPDSFQVVFHTFRGSAVNYPLAMAISALLEEKTSIRCEAIPDDNAVLIHLSRLAVEAYSGRADPLLLIKDCLGELASNAEVNFKRRLEASGIFGAAFREAAERSMILPRGMFGRRIPLWVIRQRAKRLYDRVSSYGDFPAITEAWRSCLADTFDMERFRALLEDLASGAVKLNFFKTMGPSPFARNLSWTEVSNFMYEYDERKDLLGSTGTGRGSLADRAIADALNDPSLRPRIKAAVVDSFNARQRREIPGYTPEDILSLSQWVKDRIAIPHDQWQTLAGALPPELQEQLAADPSLGGRLRTLTLSGASLPVVIHAENAALTGSGLLARLGEWLHFEGPVLPERIAEVFGCTIAEAEDALDALVETGEVIKEISVEGSGRLGGENFYCDTENYELLLRLTRKKARPQIKERPASFLVPFIAFRQGLINTAEQNSLPDTMSNVSSLFSETLSCYPAPVRLWETEIFPARDPLYKSEKLDAALNEGRLVWFGAGRERAAFASPEELELADLFTNVREMDRQETNRSGIAKSETDKSGKANTSREELFPLLCELCVDYRNFWEIKDEVEARTNKTLSSAELSAALWEASWRGLLSSDTWEGLRRGVDRGFASGKNSGAEKDPAVISVSGAKLPGLAPAYQPTNTGRARRLPHALKDRWREGSPVPGRIFSLDTEFSADSPAEIPEGLYGVSALERDEINRDKVRLLLRRWGVLCRPLLETEDLFSWAELLPAMRRMELAGELATGRFFDGIPSLQFAGSTIAEELEAAEAALAGSTAAPVYWMNAADPASPAGWNIAGLDSRLPARNAASRICFRGKDLAAVSGKSGKELELFVSGDDPDLRKILTFIVLPRTRACHPVQKIALETINGKPAAEAFCAPLLAEMGFISDRGKLFLW